MWFRDGVARSIAFGPALLACSLAIADAQSTPAPPPFARAQAHLNAGRPDSAIALLEPYFRENPGATTGWVLLGTAYKQRSRLDDALHAFERAASIRGSRAPGMYNAATVLALRGLSDSALTLLQRVKDLGVFDMQLAATAPEFATLRHDPRFTKSQFAPADFHPPFMEPVRILQEWVAEGPGDQFGWIARSVGDVDRDGVNDVVASAPTYGSAGATSRGRVYLFSGKSGRKTWQFTGDSADALGTGLEGAGDVNADGIPDVVAGAPGTGRAYILSGRDGAVLHRLEGTAREAFGTTAAGAGDQDADGHGDVIVGAPGAATDPGRAYVFSGKSGRRLLTIEGERAGDAFGSIVGGDKRGKATPLVVSAPRAGERRRGRVYTFPGTGSALPPTPGQVAGIGKSAAATPKFVIEADSSGTALGSMFVSIVGDVNGDGTADVYTTDYTNAALGPSTGRAYVVSGRDGRPLHTFTGENAGDGFGDGPGDVGDLNGDGFADLIIGAWQHTTGAPSGGRIYLYSGRDGRLLRTITARVPGETLGFDAAGIGDVDGDGVPDLLVAAAWSNVNGFRSGRVFILSGRQ